MIEFDNFSYVVSLYFRESIAKIEKLTKIKFGVPLLQVMSKLAVMLKLGRR
jgi:hypothetical protein